MEKTPFVYQRWYLRMFCSAIVLPIVFAIRYTLASVMGIEVENLSWNLIGWSWIVSGVMIILAGLAVYYKLTQNCGWFEKQGAYWVQDGIVYIHKQGKVWQLQNVTWVNGTTVSIYGMAKTALLVIQCEKQKIILASSSRETVRGFADSAMLPLLEKIVHNNPELIQDDTLDYWYEAKG